MKNPQVAPHIAIFLKSLVPHNECLIWKGYVTSKDGYGQLMVKRKVMMAHRFMYIVAFGTIKAGYVIDHKCGVRRCINPAHLEAVTIRENTQRGFRRDRSISSVRWTPIERHIVIFLGNLFPYHECILWNGHRDANGYGLYGANGKLHRAHRFSYELLNGPICKGLLLDHLCRVTNCVNPNHLEPVSSAENWRRGNGGPPGVNGKKTQCIRGHDLIAGNIYRDKAGHRRCRTCILAKQAEYKARDPAAARAKRRAQYYAAHAHRRAYQKMWRANRKAAQQLISPA